MMNVPRMMNVSRPGMPNPNPNQNPNMINPNNSLRHLLQPQGQVKMRKFQNKRIIGIKLISFVVVVVYVKPQQGNQFRPMMGMQGPNNMMNPNMNMNIRPNQPFNDPNFEYMQ